MKFSIFALSFFLGGRIDSGLSFSSSLSSTKTTRISSSLLSSHDEEHVGESTERLGQLQGPTVWTEFGRLSQENDINANLGQGYPDWTPPQFALDSLVEAALDLPQNPHQYTRTAGHPDLVQQLAERYSIHLNREVDSMSEVAVTVGASQALYMSLQTLVQPGDEVILFEPFFDLYVNQVKLAGGTPVFVPLTFVPYEETEDVVTGGTWVLDPDVLKAKVSPKTKAIILNSPHNPTGKVFTRTEMEYIAEALELTGPDCVVLSDEVYKYIIHAPPSPKDGGESPLCEGHVHFASLPGMWERTITISSAGKTFSATGWQVGWCIGPSRLVGRIHQLLPYVQFCASTLIQEALARALPKADLPYQGYESYYHYLKDTYLRKRNLLASSLQEAGFAIPDYDQTPSGGFFIFARIGKSIQKQLPSERVNVPNAAAPGGIAKQDWALCQWLIEEKGIVCIPASPFFSSSSEISQEFVRIAFCKTDETIQAAAVAFGLLDAPAENAAGIEEPVAIDQES